MKEKKYEIIVNELMEDGTKKHLTTPEGNAFAYEVEGFAILGVVHDDDISLASSVAMHHISIANLASIIAVNKQLREAAKLSVIEAKMRDLFSD